MRKVGDWYPHIIERSRGPSSIHADVDVDSAWSIWHSRLITRRMDPIPNVKILVNGKMLSIACYVLTESGWWRKKNLHYSFWNLSRRCWHSSLLSSNTFLDFAIVSNLFKIHRPTYFLVHINLRFWGYVSYRLFQLPFCVLLFGFAWKSLTALIHIFIANFP